MSSEKEKFLPAAHQCRGKRNQENMRCWAWVVRHGQGAPACRARRRSRAADRRKAGLHVACAQRGKMRAPPGEAIRPGCRANEAGRSAEKSTFVLLPGRTPEPFSKKFATPQNKNTKQPIASPGTSRVAPGSGKNRLLGSRKSIIPPPRRTNVLIVCAILGSFCRFAAEKTGVWARKKFPSPKLIL